MKIAILHPGFNHIGGAERVMVDFARALARRGHRVKVFAAGFKNQDLRDKLRGIATTYLPIASRFYDLSRNFKTVGWFLRNTFLDFDVVAASNFPSYAWLHFSRRFALRFPKIVWLCHEPPRHLYPELMLTQSLKLPGYRQEFDHLFSPRRRKREYGIDQQAVKSIDAIVANSRYTKERVETIYQRSASWQYFGLELERRELPAASLLPSVFNLLWVGRLERYKNLGNVIRALEILREQKKKWFPDLKLNVVGEGAEEGALKAMVRRNGLENIVQFHGTLKDEELVSHFQTSHLNLYLPLDEPMGLVPAEAGIWGCPSLLSNYGGPAEIAGEILGGIVADPLDPGDIAAKISYLRENEAVRKDLGEEMRTLAWQQFDIRRLAEVFEEVASRLIP